MIRIETHSPEVRKLATCPVLFDTFKRSSALPLTNALCNHAPLAVIVKLLDDHPKAISFSDTAYNRMPLSLALLHCVQEDVIMELLTRYPEAANLQDRLNRTALHYAIGNKHPMPVLERLLDINPDAVEKRDHRGWLPLHVACARGAPLALVQNLCERDASSIFIGDKNGLIPKDFIEYVDEGVRDQEVYDYLHRVTPTLSGFKFNFAGQLLGHRTGAGGWKTDTEQSEEEALRKREEGRGNNGIVDTGGQVRHKPTHGSILMFLCHYQLSHNIFVETTGTQLLGAGGRANEEAMKLMKKDDERGKDGGAGDLA